MLLIALAAALAAGSLVSWIRYGLRLREWSGYSYRSQRRPRVSDPILATLVGYGAGGGFAVLFAAILITAIAGTDRVERTDPLAALATGSSTTGAFFLGSGTVDETPTIRYVQLRPDGAATLRSIDASRAVIYEEPDNVTPRVDQICPALTDPWLAPTELSFGIGCHYEFHVPAGSILHSYEVTP